MSNKKFLSGFNGQTDFPGNWFKFSYICIVVTLSFNKYSIKCSLMCAKRTLLILYPGVSKSYHKLKI